MDRREFLGLTSKVTAFTGTSILFSPFKALASIVRLFETNYIHYKYYVAFKCYKFEKRNLNQERLKQVLQYDTNDLYRKICLNNSKNCILFKELVEGLENLNEDETLNRIYSFIYKFNAKMYVKDDEKNSWKNPFETLIDGGDCEDMALLAYFAFLFSKHFNKKKLYLIHCEVRVGGVMHMALGVKTSKKDENGEIIFKIIDPRLGKLVDSLEHSYTYIPIYSYSLDSDKYFFMYCKAPQAEEHIVNEIKTRYPIASSQTTSLGES